MKIVVLLMSTALLVGCGSRLTGYNLKASVGNTEYDDGRRALYTGGSVDAHFDVK